MARTEKVYVEPEHKDIITAIREILESYSIATNSYESCKEERNKKKKKQKEINKKEEKSSLSTREALLISDLENKQNEDSSEIITEENVQKYLDMKGEKRFTAKRFIDYYNGFEHQKIIDLPRVIDGWIERERKPLHPAGAQKKAAEKIYHPEEEQVKVYRPRDQYNSYPVYES